MNPDLRVRLRVRLTLLALLSLGIFAASLRNRWLAPSHEPEVAFAASAAAESSTRNEEDTMRFLARRVKSDPEDFVACSMLASAYLRRTRETGGLDYLERARNAAQMSLASVPAIKNTGGLAALTLAETAMHQFAAARDHARQLTQIDAGASEPYGLLGDALIELGDYPQAEAAYREMVEDDHGGAGVEIRQARLAALHGDLGAAKKHYFNAIAFIRAHPVQHGETLAWCYWQLGEMAFAGGDYAGAEKSYRDSLIYFPNYFRSLASMGRVEAARGNLKAGIVYYEQAVAVIPDPAFVAALGDLYQIAGRKEDAEAQYALVEYIGRLNQLNGALYNRQVALYYADHDQKQEEAFANATREYADRRDIYGSDAVAWTALKAGKLTIAQKASKESLRFGTQDARLFYHAGMIARAAGDATAARSYLQRALSLNPQFDPLQAGIAQKSLSALAGSSTKSS